MPLRFVTRERPKVDRIACPWLIRRFVDPQAEFLFVPADQVMAVAERERAIPFDVPDVELGHHDDMCTFDAVIQRYAIGDPAVYRMALIVRGADTPFKELAPEAMGLEAIADGFRRLFADDQAQLEAAMVVYDALYAYCKAKDAEEPD
jgi:hypothetical protein